MGEVDKQFGLFKNTIEIIPEGCYLHKDIREKLIKN